MIGRLIFRGLAVFGVFFISWLLLAQINWIGVFNFLPNNSKYLHKIEEKLGEVTLADFKRYNSELENVFVSKTIDSIVTKICTANGIVKDSLNVYIFSNSEVNAFALPDNQMVIYTGLIQKTENPEALAGVIAHELAHIQKGHVMQSLKKEIGLGVLFTVLTGQSDYTLISEISKMLVSSSFSRKMEKEADLLGVEYLINAQIDPVPFADLTSNLNDIEFKALKWINSHPMSEERSKYIMKVVDNKDFTFRKLVHTSTWEKIKEQINSDL